ncbi:MAG TPA: FAD-binding oxidoreductase, partial [Terriglobia bacterium]|nr:FAD-binding oxidoreductase [Terriglobia bacterium]
MTQKIHHALLRRVWNAGPRTRHFEFEMTNGKRLEFRAGQFISLHIGLPGRQIARAYSIASRIDNRLELVLNVSPEEQASPWLLSLKRGDVVEFTGPYGIFRLHHPLTQVSAFIATGTGIAPIRAMLQELYQDYRPSEAWLIFGVRKEADILYREEFEDLARRHPDFHFIPTLSRPEPGWSGHTGYVQL